MALYCGFHGAIIVANEMRGQWGGLIGLLVVLWLIL